MMLSSIAMARALNMSVTAEGVETSQQAEMVRAAGCDQIQGWLYFKAMSAAAVDQLIRLQQAADQRPNVIAHLPSAGIKQAKP